MKPLIALSLLLSLASLSFAEPPKAIVNGPTTGTPGEILYLDASESSGQPTHFRWSVEPEVRGRKQFSPASADVARVQIASFPGRYRYTLVVSNADGSDLLYWDVSIPGTPPPQPNPPGPGPEPDPPEPGPPEPEPTPPEPKPPQPEPGPGPLPDGQFKISADVKKFAEMVDSPHRKAEALRIAEGWEGVSAAIAAGAVTKKSEIVLALNAATNAALGASIDAWRVFGRGLAGRLAALDAEQRIETAVAWRTLIAEMVLGLKAVE